MQPAPSAMVVVPANAASCDHLQKIFGTRGQASRWRGQGEATCAIVYGPFSERLRHNSRQLHPALDAWMENTVVPANGLPVLVDCGLTGHEHQVPNPDPQRDRIRLVQSGSELILWRVLLISMRPQSPMPRPTQAHTYRSGARR